jgi:hypothetical protein
VTPKIDTRQGIQNIPSEEELVKQTIVHADDVAKLLDLEIDRIREDVSTHDWTKIKYVTQFRANFIHAADGGKFSDHEWWKLHVKLERHHCADYTGSGNIMLGDIIHMLADWTAAAKGRGMDLNYPTHKDKWTEILLKL